MHLTRQRILQALKVLLTVAVACLGVLVLWHLYNYYTYAPQTRDGKIRADVVPLAADVSGRVTAIFVHDNEVVRKDQVLFQVDRERLANALARADAAVGTAKANMTAAEREDRRYRSLAGVVSGQDIDIRRSAAEEAKAAYAQALADRDLARINLERADVKAPVNGTITNFSLRPGVYATASQPVMAIVDSDSYYIAGYFEETKLSHIRDGSRVTVWVMGRSGRSRVMSRGWPPGSTIVSARPLPVRCSPTSTRPLAGSASPSASPSVSQSTAFRQA